MDECTPIYIAMALIVGYVIAQSRRTTGYRSATLSATGSFPTNSKLLLD